ncbi:MAG: TonB-dependent receptor [Lewinellaceae bacterium]|nr:TonB-dependent receptor [Lewinellaceae bacterium]
MKKTGLICLFLMALYQLGAQPLLEKRVSLSARDEPLEEVLYQLIDKEGIQLSFSNSILPPKKRVTLEIDQQPLGTALAQILDGTPIAFRVVGGQVVLYRKKEQPEETTTYTISGYVKDAETGEAIYGAVVYEPDLLVGTYTNEFGYYSITLPRNDHGLLFSYLGYRTDTVTLSLLKDFLLDMALQPAYLAEVIVNSFADSVQLETGLSQITINLAQAARMPALGGEADLLRIGHTLPGIQTGTDGFGGISVRGGNVDQNLFLLDGVPVYNAMHGAGVYSIFNTTAVRSIQLSKGVFPAQYGGRISSVWDVQTKEGNSNFFQGEVDIGLSSGKLTLEGPFKGKKGSFFISGRRAFFDFYSEPITRRLRRENDVDGSIGYYFYDLNFKTNYQLSPKDRVYLSYYQGKDYFTDRYDQFKWFADTLAALRDKEDIDWGNRIASLRWNHNYNNKLFGNTSLTFSQYFYRSEKLIDLEILQNDTRLRRDIDYSIYFSDIRDFSLKTDFDYSASPQHQFRFGASAIKHRFQPGIVNFNQSSIIGSIELDTLGETNKQPLESYEFDAYVQDEIKIGKFLEANIGLRASALAVEDKVYLSPQPRVLLSYFPDKNLSFHASAGRVTQFLHLLSPTSFGLPKDLWVSATAKVPPQQSWQYVLGVKRKFAGGLQASLEGYYKTMSGLIVFKGIFLERINAQSWQEPEAISRGKGWSYGLEALVQWEREKASAWLGYTLAKSERQFDNEINGGRKFPTRLDRRHNFNLQFLYKFNRLWEFSLGFVYATGAAFTFPLEEYEFVQPPGSPPLDIIQTPRPVDNLNNFRLPAYHKLDLALNHYFWQRKARHAIRVGVFNVYDRRNPLYYSLRDRFDESGELNRQIIQVSLLPIFPTLRYSLEFR